MAPPVSAPPDASRGVIAWFVQNRVAANLLFLAIAAGGLVAIGDVPQEFIPETAPSVVTVRTVFPGASAAEVEAGVLVGMEDALQEVSGVAEIVGLATDGVGLLMVRAASWADFDSLRDDIRERVESFPGLPADAEDPVIADARSARLLMRVTVHGEAGERSLTEAARFVRQELLEAPGVAGVEIETGRNYEISIEVPEERLVRFGLSFDQVAAAIRRQSVAIPGGALRTGSQNLRLGVEAKAGTADDLRRIPVISTPGGGVVTVGDVATVTDGFADIESRVRMNGEPGVVLRLLQAPGTRLLDTANAVYERLPAIREALPDGLSVTPWADAWRLFDGRKDVLVRNAIEGLVLIFVVLFFALSSRVAVWTAAGIPVAFFGAFLLMPGLGVTLNMLSLFAFILALGIVVDDAIVVGENVERHTSGRTEGIAEAAVRGVRQVMIPAGFGVLTTMAAFAPLLGLPGIWGEFIGVLPRIVIPVLAFSLVDAAWILPHHMVHGGLPVRPSRRLARIRAGFQSGLEWIADTLYRPVLAGALRNRLTALAIGVSGLVLVLGTLAGGWVQVESAPPFESTMISVRVTLPPGSPYEATAEVVDRVEDAIRAVREEFRSEYGTDPQRHLLSLTGQRLAVAVAQTGIGDAGGSSGPNLGQLTWQLLFSSELRDFTAGDVADRLRARTRLLPHRGEANVTASLLGEEANASIRISGADLDALQEASAALQQRILEYPGVIQVADDLADQAPRLVARVRPEGVGLGLRAAEVGRQLRQGFYGEEVQRIQRGDDDIPVILRYPRSGREDATPVGSLRVRGAGGNVGPMDQVVDFHRESAPSVVRRLDGRRAVTVLGNVDARVASPAAVLADLQEGSLPALRERFPGLGFEVVGLAGESRETIAALNRNFLLALLLIYALLAVPLSSWTQPFVILAAVPFGLFGAFIGHVVMGLDLSLASVFGMIPLVGIVVNDALVLLDFIDQSRRRGASVSEAVLAAGPLRFRPIVLTSLTTCAGLAPLLLERSIEAQFLVPIAASLAFGVAFATLVTLLLVPVLYSVSDEVLSLLRRSGRSRTRLADRAAGRAPTSPTAR